jgi:hypothetical protein
LADALEECGGLFGRQGAMSDGLNDAVERALDGAAIRERTEPDGGGPESAQAAACTLVEVLVIAAAAVTGECELAAGGPIGLDGGAVTGFHRFSNRGKIKNFGRKYVAFLYLCNFLQ